MWTPPQPMAAFHFTVPVEAKHMRAKQAPNLLPAHALYARQCSASSLVAASQGAGL